MRAALTALATHGSRLELGVLAEAIDASTLRARGIVNGLTELLNVDGYMIVRLDPATDTVVVDLALLAAQFEIAVPGVGSR